MPRIINAYADGNNSVADAIKGLGEGMFGNESQQEVYRQNAAKLRRENDNAEPFAAATRDNNSASMRYYGALGGRTGVDVSNFNLLSAGDRARGRIDDPGLAVAQLTAHEPIASTAIGQGRALANQRAIEDARTRSAAATQLSITDRTLANDRYKTEHTPSNVWDAGGIGHIVPQSEAITGKYYTEPKLDEVKARVLAPMVNGAQPAAGPASGGATPARGVMGTEGLPDDARSMMGLPTLTPQQRIEHERDEQSRLALKPMPPHAPAEAGYSQAARDAQDTSGAWNAGRGLAMEGLGFLLNTDFTPDLHKAQNNLSNLANSTRALMASAGVRDSGLRERNNNMVIPQPNALGITGMNGGQQAERVVSLTQHLRAIHQDELRQAQDPNLPPADRTRLIAHLKQLESHINAWEELPAGQPQGAAPAALAAPPQAGPPQAAPPAQTATAPVAAQDALAQAQQAIALGAPRDRVIQRLRQNGIDPGGL